MKKETEKKIIALYHEGKDPIEIGFAVDYDASYVRRILANNGLTRKRQKEMYGIIGNKGYNSLDQGGTLKTRLLDYGYTLEQAKSAMRYIAKYPKGDISNILPCRCDKERAVCYPCELNNKRRRYNV